MPEPIPDELYVVNLHEGLREVLKVMIEGDELTIPRRDIARIVTEYGALLAQLEQAVGVA